MMDVAPRSSALSPDETRRNALVEEQPHSKSRTRRGIEVFSPLYHKSRSKSNDGGSPPHPTNLLPSKKPGGIQLSYEIKHHKYQANATKKLLN